MSTPNPIVTALCRELDATGAGQAGDGFSPPEWLLLVPAGQFTGRDSRAWVNDRPDLILENHAANRADIPADWEHATELKGPRGEEAPAAAWFPELEIRDGAVWGRVQFVPRALNQIRDREYRYYSVAFDFERDTRRVVRITSVGLTNRPNLYTQALNREEQPMALPDVIRTALRLAAGATEEQAVAAIDQLRADHDSALNRAEAPPLERFVPRADYDQALERAANAEQALTADRQTKRDGDIDAAIEQALAAKKITPATVDYHRAMCRQDGGLEQFRHYVEAAPAVIGDTGLDKKPPQADDTALNRQQEVIAKAFGNSAETLAKYAPAH